MIIFAWKNGYHLYSTHFLLVASLPGDGENMVLMLDLKPLCEQSAVLPNLAEN